MDSGQIKKGICEFLQENGLHILKPDYPTSDNELLTAFRSKGLRLGVHIKFSPEKGVVAFIVYFPNQKPIERDEYTFQILNEFYAKMLSCHFAFLPEGHGMTLRSGYVLTEDKFNKKKFKEHFTQIIHDAVVYYPQLKQLLAEQAGNA